MIRILKKFIMLFYKRRITLNIESDCVRVLCVKGSRVVKYGEAVIPQGLISYAMINDPEGVAGIINALFKNLKLPRRNVIVCVSGFRTVVRYVSLPKMGKRKMKEAVMWAADREMPVSLDTLAIWWQVLEKTSDEQKLVLCGVPRNLLNSLRKTINTAGVGVKALDSKPLALNRLSPDNQSIVADLENDTMSVIVRSEGVPRIVQTLLMRSDNIEVEDKAKRLSDDLFRTVEFFNSTANGSRINNTTPVFITGGVATDDVIRMIEENIGRDISLPDKVITAPDDFPYAKYGVNIGLYLRDVKRKTANTNKKLLLKPDLRKTNIFSI